MNPERKAKLNEIGFDFNPEGIPNEDRWDFQFKRLRLFKESHGHCELFWAVDCFIFILSTPTNTPPYSFPALQVKCHKRTRKTRHWATGLTRSVPSSRKVEWSRNEQRNSTRLVSISIPRAWRTRIFGICSSRSCRTIMENMVTVSSF
jgi:hypothetical protein